MDGNANESNDAPIVVAVDGSDGSLAAVRYAAATAAAIGCDLRVIHIAPSYLPNMGIAPWTGLVDVNEFEGLGHDILKIAARTAYVTLPRDRVTTALELGERTPLLLSAAKAARLLVIGDDRSPLLGRLGVGGFIGTIAARTSVPLVAVPPNWVASDRPATERRVVLGIKDSQRIPFELLRAGFRIAHEHGARLEIVHAWDMPAAYAGLLASVIDYSQWESMTARSVEGLVAPLREELPDVVYTVTSQYGQPAHILCTRAHDAELLLLARHAPDIPPDNFGATGKAVLREATCPVEVLPIAERVIDSTTSTDVVLSPIS